MEAYAKLVIVAVLLVAATGLEPAVAAGQSTICGMSLDGLMSCRPSVSGKNPVPPSPACCTALSGADMQCMCKYKNSKELSYLGINPNLAMQLPEKCDLKQVTVPCA